MTIDIFIYGFIKAEKSAASIHKKNITYFLTRNIFEKNFLMAIHITDPYLDDVKFLRLIDVMEKIDLLPPQEIINETSQVDNKLYGKIIENLISIKRALSMELKREE